MSYRRLDPVQAARRWREFSLVSLPLFRRAGLPAAMSEHVSFAEFLEHGHLARGGAVFSVADLDEEQRQIVRRLVEKYVDWFGDPGLCEEIRLLASGSAAQPDSAPE